MKNLPTRCIDPIFKSCQDCTWGYIKYDDGVETYADTIGCCFESGCNLGFDKGRPEDEPTEEEMKEFDEWLDKMHEKRGHSADTTKSPAPAATGTSENDNTEAVITNNDTTNCRACQVGGLSMSAGGGKSAMYAKCCEEIAEIVLRLYKKMSEQDQDTFLLGEIYGRAMAAQEEGEE